MPFTRPTFPTILTLIYTDAAGPLPAALAAGSPHADPAAAAHLPDSNLVAAHLPDDPAVALHLGRSSRPVAGGGLV